MTQSTTTPTPGQARAIQQGKVQMLLAQFMGANQKHVVFEALRGEEAQYFKDKLNSLANLVHDMPKTYEQDSKGEDAIAYLHYFTSGADFWITEKDAEAQHLGCQQLQAFGLADIFQDGGDVGYISIAEILEAGAELDFHFEPKPLRDCRKH